MVWTCFLDPNNSLEWTYIISKLSHIHNINLLLKKKANYNNIISDLQNIHIWVWNIHMTIVYKGGSRHAYCKCLNIANTLLQTAQKDNSQKSLILNFHLVLSWKYCWTFSPLTENKFLWRSFSKPRNVRSWYLW